LVVSRSLDLAAFGLSPTTNKNQLNLSVLSRCCFASLIGLANDQRLPTNDRFILAVAYASGFRRWRAPRRGGESPCTCHKSS